MFWSIPSSTKEIVTKTPFAARSIRAVFFENKNNGVFYQSNPDRISITIDGKMIARNLFTLPFFTVAPTLKDRFDWTRCALIVNMNVNNSEVIISGVRDNDFNIVFVYDDKEINESKGFDFIETKEIVVAMDGGMPDAGISALLRGQKKETAVFTDYAPLYIFAYPYFIQKNSNKIHNVPVGYLCGAEIDIAGVESVLLPEKLSLSAISANQFTTWREMAYRFEKESSKNFNLVTKLITGSPVNVLATSPYPTVTIDGATVDIYEMRFAFCFMYKKLI